MSKQKKPRNNKYVPKKVIKDCMGFVKTGLTLMPDNQKTTLQLKNYAALLKLKSGEGDRDSWNTLVGAINMTQVMCELGTGKEYRKIVLAASDALLAVGKRHIKWNKFEFCGDELEKVGNAMEVHDAQLSVSRVIDIEQATDEVLRRINFDINVKKVMVAA